MQVFLKVHYRASITVNFLLWMTLYVNYFGYVSAWHLCHHCNRLQGQIKVTMLTSEGID